MRPQKAVLKLLEISHQGLHIKQQDTSPNSIPVLPPENARQTAVTNFWAVFELHCVDIIPFLLLKIFNNTNSSLESLRNEMFLIK